MTPRIPLRERLLDALALAMLIAAWFALWVALPGEALAFEQRLVPPAEAQERLAALAVISLLAGIWCWAVIASTRRGR